MAGSQKKVIVRRFSPGLLWGYLPQSGFVRNHALDLLDLGGRIQSIPLSDVKYAAFVRDFNTNDSTMPERLLRKTFLARPRTEGLWLRLALRDGDAIEGLAPLDVSLADGFADDHGVQMVPPDIRGNTQRLYIPRAAMDAMNVQAVVTSPSKRKVTVAPVAEAEQPDLFSMQLPENSRPH